MSLGKTRDPQVVSRVMAAFFLNAPSQALGVVAGRSYQLCYADLRIL